MLPSEAFSILEFFFNPEKKSGIAIFFRIGALCIFYGIHSGARVSG